MSPLPLSFPAMLKITMVSPTLPAERTGNGITAARWSRRLGEFGHRVRIVRTYDGRPCDLLVVLHARKSAASALRFRRQHSERPFVVALTGTDLYGELQRSQQAQRAVAGAAALVLLQPRGLQALPRALRRKAHVILQSAVPPRRRQRRRTRSFDIVVLGHLRAVKDPLRAALAARRLPRASRLRILHAGRAMTPAFARRARDEMRCNPRYHWLGDVSHAEALRLLARSRALVLSSRREGGANVISEAAVAGVPVLASRIPGSLGLLGGDYPGTFEVGDTRALAVLLHRLEADPGFAARLRRRMRRLAPHFRPARERAAWGRLLAALPRRRP